MMSAFSIMLRNVGLSSTADNMQAASGGVAIVFHDDSRGLKALGGMEGCIGFCDNPSPKDLAEPITPGVALAFLLGIGTGVNISSPVSAFKFGFGLSIDGLTADIPVQVDMSSCLAIATGTTGSCANLVFTVQVSYSHVASTMSVDVYNSIGDVIGRSVYEEINLPFLAQVNQNSKAYVGVTASTGVLGRFQMAPFFLTYPSSNNQNLFTFTEGSSDKCTS